MFQRPRGTKDIYGVDQHLYDFIFDVFEQLTIFYNVEKITTPIFEHAELFNAAGEQSDIVTKEIYRFEDLSNRKLALRPEGTAPVARAIIENRLVSLKKYNKLYYMGPMFRYEKPQKGRLRQFYQIGVEFTSELCTNAIVDTITLAYTFLSRLRISNFTLHINSLGTQQERQNYIEALKQYFRKHKEALSSTSQERIELNPLRILDDKEDSKLDVVKNAPKISDFYSDETKQELNEVLSLLDLLNIDYVIDSSLVRGLDYYSGIVYEFISNSEIVGSQNTLIGGGCYLDLIGDDSSNKINGVGFGVGVERIHDILSKDKDKLETFIPPIDIILLIENEEQYKKALPLVFQIRNNNISCEYNYQVRKFKKLLESAQKQGPILIAFQELKQQNTSKWTIKTPDKNYVVDYNNFVNKVRDILDELLEE